MKKLNIRRNIDYRKKFRITKKIKKGARKEDEEKGTPWND